MSARQPRRSRFAEILVGLASLIALAAMLVGYPIAMLAATRVLAPALPSLSHPGDLFHRTDSDMLVLVMLAVGWLAWALFTLTVIIQIPATIRGIRAPRLPALGSMQRTAAVLLTAIAAILPAAGSAMAADSSSGLPITHSPGSQVVASAPARPAPATTSSIEHESRQGQSRAAATRSYTVQDRDTLWSIAEHELGDGARWRDIAQENRGRTMPGGAVFSPREPIHAGWVLLLPEHQGPTPHSAADNGLQHTASHASPEARHEVVPGDTLSSIAERDYGDPTLWPVIFDANKGAAQNGGHFDNPNLIYPGDDLTIPHAVVPTREDRPSPAPPTTPVTASSATGSPRFEEPIPSSSPAAPTMGSTRMETSISSSSLANGTASVALSVDRSDQAMIEIGISAISAAAFLALLAERRRLQQVARRVGQRIAMPPPHLAAVEHRLHAAADPAGREFLDRVLRSLAHHSATTGRLIPEANAALLRSDGVELRLTQPCPPIAPFSAVSETAWWCPRSKADLLPRAVARKQPHPYPALVTIGTTDDGDGVLVDLEHYGVLEIGGDRAQSADVIRSLGVELPWSEYVAVTSADLELSEHLTPNPVHVDPDTVLPAFEQWTSSVSGVLPDGSGSEPLRTARIDQTHPDATTSQVVLATADWTTPQAVDRLNAGIGRDPRPGAAAVVAVGDDVPAGTHRVTIDAEGKALLPDLNLAVTMQRVNEGQYGQLLGIMGTTAGQAVEDAEWHDCVVAFAEGASQQMRLNKLEARPVATTGAVRPSVHLFGTVNVVDTAPIVDPRHLEMAAYIRLNPGADIRTMSADMVATVPSVGTGLAQLRNLLGNDADGSAFLPLTPDGRLTFTGRMGCDWTAFEEHRRAGRFSEALILVRGEPFADAWSGRFGWAEPLRQSMVSTVIDVAHVLAESYLAARDYEAARAAVSRGLVGVPFSELLYRDLMLIVTAEAGRDSNDEFAALLAAFNTMCADYNVSPSQETVTVINRIGSRVRFTHESHLGAPTRR
ncbi:LysM peptidoglycan-binding domain-containing protein [Catenulispora sp. NL8]|uniref:LysM peptidoglycan-binding domain-containing protein n=1 Tax=Catenulispora pinistramenti TaxID=2705254 RepID=A0ABS5KGZ6_9ACTN|nr:LysM peptidoglycan-binding domain-containing protein [Catenulispora pinistramenti]MBS2545368.1 LysM peptidoglycan-binding domain-containing protein [Catenulispora pinistramenti]